MTLHRRRLREIARHHRQNHAMLLMLLRLADLPTDDDDARQFEHQLAEIDRLIEDLGGALHQLVVAAPPAEAERRVTDRRRGDRRVAS